MTARALQGQARCLAKAGKKEEAISLLTGPLEEKRFWQATDAQGRLIVPNAELMALELLKDSAPDRARGAFEILASEPARLRQSRSVRPATAFPDARGAAVVS